MSGGDPKALGDSPLAHLVLRALALRAGVGMPANAEQRRTLCVAATRGVPLRVTLHQLIALPITHRVDQVFVCENPAVLRAATGLGPGAAPCRAAPRPG